MADITIIDPKDAQEEIDVDFQGNGGIVLTQRKFGREDRIFMSEWQFKNLVYNYNKNKEPQR